MNKSIVFIIFLVLGIVACLIAIGLAIYFYAGYNEPRDYSVIFDASPSATNMHVYEWNPDFNQSESNQENLAIKEVHSCKASDIGIDRMRRDELITKLTSCINETFDFISPERKNRTKISLLAAPEMRLDPSYPNLNEALALIRHYFESSGYPFNRFNHAKFVNGRDKAFYSWLASNFKNNNFEHPDEFNNRTTGQLDLDESTASLTFIPKNPNERTKEATLFGAPYRAYSESFQCYGVGEAELMYRTALLRMFNYSSQLRAACYPTNSQQQLTKTQLVRSSCANGKIYNDPIPNQHMQRDYIFYGHSDYRYCVEEIRDLFKRKQPCSINNDACSFKNTNIANVKNAGNFVAHSEFQDALADTGRLFNKSFESDMGAFQRATADLCSFDLNNLLEINRANNASLEIKTLTNMCFRNTYVIELLNQLGFDSFKNINFIDRATEKNANWTLGYVVNELNSLSADQMPIERYISNKEALIYFLIALIGAVVLATILLLILITYLISDNN